MNNIRIGTFRRVMIKKTIDEKDGLTKRNNYLQTEVNLLKFVTVWHLDHASKLVNILYRLVSIARFILMVLASAGQIAQIYFSPNLSRMSSAVDISTLTASASYKLMFMIIFQKDYSRLVGIVQEKFIERPALHLKTDGSWIPETEMVSMKLWLKNVTRNLNIYVITGLLVMSLWSGGPLFQTADEDILLRNSTTESTFRDYSEILPLNAWVPFDVDKSPTYEIVYVLELVPLMDAATVYLIGDSFFFAMIYVVCGQLQIIKCTLSNIQHIRSSTEVVKIADNFCNKPSIHNHYFCNTKGLQDNEQNYRSKGDSCNNHETNRNKMIYKPHEIEKAMNDIIVDCINHHQLLLQFMNDLERLSRSMIIVDLLHAIISLSFALFQTTESDTIINYIRTTMFVMVCIFHQFLNNFFGEYVIQQQLDIHEAVYSLPWEQEKNLKRFQNIMTMVTMRTRKPVVLSGLKMYFLRYKTFMEFMKALLSYFMVLRQLHDDGK